MGHLKSLIILSIMFLTVSVSAADKKFLPSSFRLNFTQVFMSTLTGKEKKSEGKLDYLFPGHIYFEISTPDKSLFISNPKTSWYYVPPFDPAEPGEVIIESTEKIFLPKFFDALKGGLKSNDLYSVEQKGTVFNLTFTKKGVRQIEVERAQIYFSSQAKTPYQFKDIEYITFTSKDKKEVKLVFDKIDTLVNLATSHFTFEIPPNTKQTRRDL